MTLVAQVRVKYHVRCPGCNAALALEIIGDDVEYRNRCWRCKGNVKMIRRGGVDISFDVVY